MAAGFEAARAHAVADAQIHLGPHGTRSISFIWSAALCPPLSFFSFPKAKIPGSELENQRKRQARRSTKKSSKPKRRAKRRTPQEKPTNKALSPSFSLCPLAAARLRSTFGDSQHA